MNSSTKYFAGLIAKHEKWGNCVYCWVRSYCYFSEHESLKPATQLPQQFIHLYRNGKPKWVQKPRKWYHRPCLTVCTILVFAKSHGLHLLQSRPHPLRSQLQISRLACDLNPSPLGGRLVDDTFVTTPLRQKSNFVPVHEHITNILHIARAERNVIKRVVTWDVYP